MPYEDWHDLQGYYRDSTRLHDWIGALPDLDMETCMSQPPKPEPVESSRSDSESDKEEKSPPLKSPPPISPVSSHSDHETHEKDKETLLPIDSPESPKSEVSSSHSPSPKPVKTKAIKRKLPNPSTHMKEKPPKKRRLNENANINEGEDGGEEGKDGGEEGEEKGEGEAEDEDGDGENEEEETMSTHLDDDEAPTPEMYETQTTPVMGRSARKRSKPDPDNTIPTPEEAALMGGPPSKKVKPNPDAIDITSTSSDDDESEKNASKNDDKMAEMQPTLLASTLDPKDDMYNSFPNSQGGSQTSVGFSHINDNDEEEGFKVGLEHGELKLVGTLEPFGATEEGNESEEEEVENVIIPETVQTEDESPQIDRESPRANENESEEMSKEKS